MIQNCLTTAILTTLILTLLPDGTIAQPSIAYEWMDYYSESLSDDNMEKATGSICQLCHASRDGGDSYNPYGWQLKSFDALNRPTRAFKMAEEYNSDKDKKRKSNLEEIKAGSQPGWRRSSKNRVFSGQGKTDYSVEPDNLERVD